MHETGSNTNPVKGEEIGGDGSESDALLPGPDLELNCGTIHISKLFHYNLH